MFCFIYCKYCNKGGEYKGQFYDQSCNYLLFCGCKVCYFEDMWCVVYDDVYIGKLLYCL